MAESITIQKNPNLENSQDYAFLREKGMEYISALGSKIWTDYNIHDPGITILEMLAYSITDLGYRIGYDIEDILSLSPEKKYFHTAREIFANAPVTISDFRKVLIDIPGIQNAWLAATNRKDDLKDNVPGQEVEFYVDLKKSELTYSDKNEFGEVNPPVYLNGLYRVLLEFEDSDEFGDLNNTIIDWEVGDLEVENDFPSWTELRNRPDADLVREWILHGENVHPITILPNSDGSFFTFDSGRSAYRVQVRIQFTLPYKPDGLFYYLDLGFYVDFEGSLTVADATGGITAMITEGELLDFYQGKIRETLQIVEKAECRLHEVRSFDEDYFKIDTLKTEEIVVCADIELAPTADVNEVQAEILLRLGFFISPPINWYRLQEMLDKGYTSDQIFEGPNLNSGFIDPEELESAVRLTTVRASDLIQIIMDVPGVLAVKELLIADFLEGEFANEGETWELALSGGNNYIPRLSEDKSKFSFYKSGLPFLANKTRTQNILMELKAKEIKPRLKDVNLDIPVPEGEDRNIGRYHSLQNDFPLVYGVGQEGVPSGEGDLREAQARQLKAFLTFFDQVLANYFSQLANVRELFSMDSNIKQTYFYQLLVDSSDLLQISQLRDQFEIDQIDFIDDADALESFQQLYEESKGIKNLRELYSQYRDGEFNAAVRYTDIEDHLSQITESEERFIERRNKFLDHLLARFNESFAEYSLLMFTIDGDKAIDELVEDKLSFLNDYPRLSSMRGSGFNYQPQCCECGGALGFTLRWEGSVTTDIRVYHNITGGEIDLLYTGVTPGTEILVQTDPISALPNLLTVAPTATGSVEVEVDTSCNTDFRGSYGDFRILSYEVDPSWRLWDTDNVTGLKRRVGRLLGVNDITRKSLACDLFVIEPNYVDETAFFRYLDAETDETVMFSAEEYPSGEDYVKELKSGEEFIGELCAKDMIERAIYYTELGYLVHNPEAQGATGYTDFLDLTYTWYPTQGVTEVTGSNGAQVSISPTCSTTYTVTAQEGTLEAYTDTVTVFVTDCCYPEGYAAVGENEVSEGDFPNSSPTISSDLSLDNTIPLGLSGQYAVVTDADPWGSAPGELVGVDHTPGGGTYFLLCANNAAHRAWYTSQSVESGKTYHFSVWVRNCFADPVVPDAEKPQFQLTVDDSLGTQSLSGDYQMVSVGEDWVQICGAYEATADEVVTFALNATSDSPGMAFVYGVDDIEIVEIAEPDEAVPSFLISAGDSVELDTGGYRFLIVNPCWDPDEDPLEEVVAISRGYLTEEARNAAAEKTEQDILRFCAAEGFHVLEHLLFRPRFKGTPPVNQQQEAGTDQLELDLVWQTFMPSWTGNLTAIEVFGGFDQAGTLRIYEGSGTLMEEVHSQPFVPVTNELQWHRFTLYSQDPTTGAWSLAVIPVTAESEYRFEIEVEEGLPTGEGIVYEYYSGTGGYDRGTSSIGPDADLKFRIWVDNGTDYEDANGFLPVCVNLIQEEEPFDCTITNEIINCGTGLNCPPPILGGLGNSISSGSGFTRGDSPGVILNQPNQFDPNAIEAYARYLDYLDEKQLRGLLGVMQTSRVPRISFILEYNTWLEETRKETARKTVGDQDLVQFLNQWIDALRSYSKDENPNRLLEKLPDSRKRTLYDAIHATLLGEKISADLRTPLVQMTQQEKVELMLYIRVYLSGLFDLPEKETFYAGFFRPENTDLEDAEQEVRANMLMELLAHVNRHPYLVDMELFRLVESLTVPEKETLLEMLVRVRKGEKPTSEEEKYLLLLPEALQDRLTVNVAKSHSHTARYKQTLDNYSQTLERFVGDLLEAGSSIVGRDLNNRITGLGEKLGNRLLAQSLKYRLGGQADSRLEPLFEDMNNDFQLKMEDSLTLVDKTGFPEERTDGELFSRRKVFMALQNIAGLSSGVRVNEIRAELKLLTELEQDLFLAELHRYRWSNNVDRDFFREVLLLRPEDVNQFYDLLISIPATDEVEEEADTHILQRERYVLEFLSKWTDSRIRSRMTSAARDELLNTLTPSATLFLASELILEANRGPFRIQFDKVRSLIARMQANDRTRLLDLLIAKKGIVPEIALPKYRYEYDFPDYLDTLRGGLTDLHNVIVSNGVDLGSNKVRIRLRSIEMTGRGIGDDWVFDFRINGQQTRVRRQINGGERKYFTTQVLETDVPSADRNMDLLLEINTTEEDPTYNDYGSGRFQTRIQNVLGRQVFYEELTTYAEGGEARGIRATHRFEFEVIIGTAIPPNASNQEIEAVIPSLSVIRQAILLTDSRVVGTESLFREDAAPEFEEIGQTASGFVNTGKQYLEELYDEVREAYIINWDQQGANAGLLQTIDQFREYVNEVYAEVVEEIEDDDLGLKSCREAFEEMMDQPGIAYVDAGKSIRGGTIFFQQEDMDLVVQDLPHRADFDELTLLVNLVLADEFETDPSLYSLKERQTMIEELIARFARKGVEDMTVEEKEGWLQQLLNTWFSLKVTDPDPVGTPQLVDLMLAKFLGENPDSLSNAQKYDLLVEIIGEEFGVDLESEDGEVCLDYIRDLLDGFCADEGIPNPYYPLAAPTAPPQQVPGKTPPVVSNNGPELVEEILISLFPPPGTGGIIPPNLQLGPIRNQFGCYKFILRDVKNNILVNSDKFDSLGEAYYYRDLAIADSNRENKNNYSLETTSDGKYFFTYSVVDPNNSKNLIKVGTSPIYDTSEEMEERLLTMACIECDPPEPVKPGEVPPYCEEDADPYSFRATVLIPSWPRKFRSPGFRDLAEKILRLEAPAHVALKICWLDRCQMEEFEMVYRDWLEANGDCENHPGDVAPYLNQVIEKLNNLRNVYPGQTLHDCETEGGEAGRIILGNSSIGSL